MGRKMHAILIRQNALKYTGINGNRVLDGLKEYHKRVFSVIKRILDTLFAEHYSTVNIIKWLLAPQYNFLPASAESDNFDKAINYCQSLLKTYN